MGLIIPFRPERPNGQGGLRVKTDDTPSYIYQSEGFPRTGYFIPAHVGTGAGQIWEILPPAPSGHFLAKKEVSKK